MVDSVRYRSRKTVRPDQNRRPNLLYALLSRASFRLSRDREVAAILLALTRLAYIVLAEWWQYLFSLGWLQPCDSTACRTLMKGVGHGYQ
jgi:hypothetical protein